MLTLSSVDIRHGTGKIPPEEERGDKVRFNVGEIMNYPIDSEVMSNAGKH